VDASHRPRGPRQRPLAEVAEPLHLRAGAGAGASASSQPASQPARRGRASGDMQHVWSKLHTSRASCSAGARTKSMVPSSFVSTRLSSLLYSALVRLRVGQRASSTRMSENTRARAERRDAGATALHAKAV
jgi:hypothetical protein